MNFAPLGSLTVYVTSFDVLAPLSAVALIAPALNLIAFLPLMLSTNRTSLLNSRRARPMKVLGRFVNTVLKQPHGITAEQYAEGLCSASLIGWTESFKSKKDSVRHRNVCQEAWRQRTPALPGP